MRLFVLFGVLIQFVYFKELRADPPRLFQTFVRSHSSLAEDAHKDVMTHLKERVKYLNQHFPYLKAPRDLILVVSNDANTTSYRAGEIILPFTLGESATDLSESEKEAKAAVLRDFYLAMAYFDSNMIFPLKFSSNWDTYRESYLLLKRFYRLNSFADEDEFERKSSSNRESAIHDGDFDRKVAESERRAAELKKKIQERNKNFNVRQSDAFVFEMHATMSFLFSDLMVGVLYQDAEKMSELLPHIKGTTLAREAEYRSLSKDFSSDYPNPRGYSAMRFYAPIRKELWNWIRSGNASREVQLRRLDTVFLRMRVLMADILKAYDKVNPRFSNHPVAEEGTTHSYLKAIGFDREKLNNRLALVSCKTALGGE